ncbi:MAG: TatD family hydrolase [Spirochaetota bacterium]|nr:TatD family hydrolase [Spirochaetota bacterium]
MFIDSHVHFDLCLENKDLSEENLIDELQKNDICYAVHVSIDNNGLSWAYEFSKRHKGVFYSIGIHPSSKAGVDDLHQVSAFINRIMSSGDSMDLFGIGETGLDFYRMNQPRDIQIRSFEYQVGLAKKWDLPLIVHSRDAFDETIRVLREKSPNSGIMHCFSGDRAMATRILDLGLYISFAGNLTYKNAHNLHDAASFIPLDMILLETDAPFLTPVPFRGKRNRPKYVKHTYEYLAILRNESLLRVEDSLYQNFTNLLKNRGGK